MVPGTASAESLEEWSDLTAEVDGVSDDGLVWVVYAGPLPTGHFAPDTSIDAAPF